MLPSTSSLSIYQLLRNCTVRIELNNKPNGTGFFVAPGRVLTCAHVFDGAASGSLAITWKQQKQPARLIQGSSSDYPDLALLEVDIVDHPCVYLQDDAQPFDRLYTYGYPDNYPNGDPATPECEGTAGDEQPLLRLKNAQIRPGMSGSPVLNQRTQHTCGIIQSTRGRETAMGGRALPVSMILHVFPELVGLQRHYHEQNDTWSKSTKAVNVFYVYDEEDEALQKKLRTHLSLLRRQNLIAELFPEKILPGDDVPTATNANLDTAEIILLLVSADFINSDYCYSTAMTRALQRKAENSARVIPIILKECDWQSAPFHSLQVLPRNKQPIASAKNLDEALKNIATELRFVIAQQTKGTTIV
jgi:hypothetical protein